MSAFIRELYLQPDPIGIKKGENHLYTYVGNNPVGSIDPLGLDFKNIGNKVVWVLIDKRWVPVSPGTTLVGETDAAVSVPESKDGECSKKCRAYKWVDCYDAEGRGFSDGGLDVKLTYCAWSNIQNDPKKTWVQRYVFCSTPFAGALGHTVRGGWVDPYAEFGSAPSGCRQ